MKKPSLGLRAGQSKPQLCVAAAAPPLSREVDKITQIRALACSVAGCESFAELATMSLARQFLRKGRRQDARRIVRAYLRKHPSTPRIAALVREVA